MQCDVESGSCKMWQWRYLQAQQQVASKRQPGWYAPRSMKVIRSYQQHRSHVNNSIERNSNVKAIVVVGSRQARNRQHSRKTKKKKKRKKRSNNNSNKDNLRLRTRTSLVKTLSSVFAFPSEDSPSLPPRCQCPRTCLHRQRRVRTKARR